MVQQILIHAVNPATALPHAWLNKAKSQRLILKGKIDAEQNWTGAKVGVFCPPPPHHDMYSSGAKSRSAVCSVILYSVRAALVFVGSGTGCSDGKLTALLAEVRAREKPDEALEMCAYNRIKTEAPFTQEMDASPGRLS